MSDFNFSQYVAPVQQVSADTSGGVGGNGGESSAVALGYNTAETGDSVAVGGHGGYAGGGHGTGVGGSGGDSAALSEAGDDDYGWGYGGWGYGDGEYSSANSEGGDGGPGLGIGGPGGYAGGGHAESGDTGDATTLGYTTAGSSADGGSADGGPAYVHATQNAPVVNDFDFKNSFNEDNDGVDNQGGLIYNSTVAGDDIKGSLNSDDDVVVHDSFKTDNSVHHIDASDDDYTFAHIQDSYNQDNDDLDLDLGDVDIDLGM